jgi:hypothetical protein
VHNFGRAGLPYSPRDHSCISEPLRPTSINSSIQPDPNTHNATTTIVWLGSSSLYLKTTLTTLEAAENTRGGVFSEEN